MTQKDIISFWRDIEVFNLPDLQKDILHLKPNTTLPWVESRAISNPKYTWRYTLYFGKIAKAEVVSILEDLLSEPNIDWNEPPTGHTCFATIILDEAGRPNQKSYLQASYIHGVNCLIQKFPVADVANRLAKQQEQSEHRYHIPSRKSYGAESENSNGSIISWQHLTDEISVLRNLLGKWYTPDIQIYYEAKEVPKNSKGDPTFLNSFYLDDLNKLYNCDWDTEEIGNSLKAYLNVSVEGSKRKDVIKSREDLIDCLDPINIPAGRWPTNLAHGLYTAQLGAICTALEDLNADGGILGVNGPPGTGKTTLLKDIIADIVVQRAERILYCKKLFFDHENIKCENRNNHFYYTNTTVFSDSGIVVSSSNNAAVENITKELPSIKGLEPELIANGYFSECSQRLINEPSWGILSAALGNATNRTNFYYNFWRNGSKPNEIGLAEYLHSFYKDPENDTTSIMMSKFEDSKIQLSKLLSEWRLFQKEASHFHNLLKDHLRNIYLVESLPKEIQNLNVAVASEKTNLDILKIKLDQINSIIGQIHKSLTLKNSHKPFLLFFQKLFKTRIYKKWAKEVDFYQKHLLQTTQEAKACNDELKKSEFTLSQLVIKRNLKESSSSYAKVNILKYQKLKGELQKKYKIENTNLVDNVFAAQAANKIHLANAYSSNYINTLRSEIFTASLAVHKYAILAHAKQFKNNLNTFFEILSDRLNVSNEILLQLWDTFFFCVPVVSTTLASVSRLFSSHGKESIGWLLLDEAGQATPQSAAGIIWRSKRCIVVGDPLQIEPVFNNPVKLVAALRKENYVNDTVWSPLVSSVQMLADRISVKGTYMTQGIQDEKIWTGFPLRTHSRCSDPMFSIANKIAYSNQMVKAKEDTITSLIPSTWYHVAGIEIQNKHVVIEELQVLNTCIGELRNQKYNAQIFVISPFKTVALACQNFYRNDKSVICGTIHTFQGREAEVVFLVLGSNLASPGARTWAAQKPNMLNVALTRAQMRFYVIGNKNLWSKLEYFKDMHEMLK